jgi:hypothetical protein
MREVWDEINQREMSVRIDTKDYQAVIYQGLKMIKEGEKYAMLSTECDYYTRVSPDIQAIFLTCGLDAGMRAYKRDKYMRQMEDFKAPVMQKHLQDKIDRL